MNQDVVTMSQRELQRLPVLEAVVARQVTQVEAARCLDLSPRQVRRLTGRLRQEGPRGVAHRTRGRPSNHRTPERVRRRVLGLIREHYADFGPTLAAEKLAERHQLHLSDETVRQWMRAAGLVNGQRRRRPARQWRERRACAGQMVQMDGSHHAWLEARGPKLVLMGYIDDATGKTYAHFYDAEDLPAALDSFRRYCRLYGIPQSVYLDRLSLYRASRAPTLQEQLAGQDPQSQFERALSELGVQVIHANSPQAKGRVERLFGTFQDRLVKELRLAGVRTPGAANACLPRFLQIYNRRFACAPRQPGNLHRPAPSGTRLAEVLCEKRPRVVANDGTISFRGQRLQLYPPGLRPLAKQGVVVTISPRGRLQVLHEGRALAYRPIAAPPPRPPAPVRTRERRGGARTPAADHPWRRIGRALQREKWRQRQTQNRTFLSWRKPDISTLA